jgi:hypothetical protein
MQNSMPGDPSGRASMQLPAKFVPQAWPGLVHAGGKLAAGSRVQNFTPPPRSEVLHISPGPQPAAAGATPPAAPIDPPPAAPRLPAAPWPANELDMPATPSAAPEADADPVEPVPLGAAQPPQGVTVRSAPQGMKP